MFCVSIMSDGLQCVFGVAACGFGHCRASQRSKILTVCLLTFFLLIGVVLAPILVTTLVSRRYSTLRVWSQRKTHGSDKPRTQSIQRCPLLHSSIPPSTPQEENKVFSMVSGSATLVFLDPQKQKNYTVFTIIRGRTLSCSLTRSDQNTCFSNGFGEAAPVYLDT